MSFLGSRSQIMDDLVFHELWLAKQKFRNFESNGESSSSEGDNDSETENESDYKDLFKKDRDEHRLKNKKTRSIIGSRTSEWMAAFMGVFFVAAVAGVASYRVYHSNMSDELNNAKVMYPFQMQADQKVPSSNSKRGDPSVEDNDTPLVIDKNKTVPQGMYNEIMLPKNLEPTNYVLYLSIDGLDWKGKSPRYNGLVKITLKCVKDTDRIVFHSARTRNTYAEIKKIGKNHLQNNDIIKIVKTQYNPLREMVAYTTSKNLTAGSEYSLFIAFKRELTHTEKDGFFLTTYTDGESKKHVMANTDFEPVAAHRAFPCFDEPSYKATFELFIQHPREFYHAISNMPIKRKIELGIDRTETHFAKTPKMSTYLVGWAVTGYQFSKTIIGPNALKIRVFAPKGRTSEASFAEGMAPYCVKYFEEKIKINYTLPKMDLVPLAHMSAGADEVWGMMIFMESSLLYNPAIDSFNSLKYTATTICHEISHMWFGDLVTMKWWNDLWLKESFAAYLENLPVARKYPEWDLETSNYLSANKESLNYDSSPYTHPIATKELDLQKMTDNYDPITYDKGSCVVTMLAKYVGDKSFFEGVHDFLMKYKYSNANATQFWESMGKSIPTVDVPSMMDSWVNQPGYPVVLMTLNKAKDELDISQDRFTFQNKNVTGITEKDLLTKWQIPLVIQKSNSVKPTKYFMTAKKVATLGVNFTGTNWFIGNKGATGFYRVYYDKENWLALEKVLEHDHKQLAAIDRASLLGDVSAFARYKYMTLPSALEFTFYLAKERHYVPWTVGNGIVLFARGLFYETNLKKCFDKYVDQLISPVLDDLNKISKHTQNEKQLIGLMTDLAVMIDKRPLVDEVNERFLTYLVRDGHYFIPSNLLSIVLGAGIKYGQSYEWDALYDRFKKAKSMNEAELILGALSSTRDTKLLQRFLALATNSSVTSVTHKQSVLRSLCSNRESNNMTWQYVKSNINAIKAENEVEKSMTQALLSSCLSSRKTVEGLKEVEEFAKAQGMSDSVMLKRIEEQIKYNIELVKEKDLVAHWFNRKRNIQC